MRRVVIIVAGLGSLPAFSQAEVCKDSKTTKASLTTCGRHLPAGLTEAGTTTATNRHLLFDQPPSDRLLPLNDYLIELTGAFLDGFVESCASSRRAKCRSTAMAN